MPQNIKKEFGNTRKPDLTSLVYGKVPPQAPELECSVLGAIMLEKNRLEEVLGIIHSEECFYVDANQKIYAAICRLFNMGMPVDLLTITEELRKNNDLEIVGGAYYITKLTIGVVSSAHVEAHARIVMEKYLSREIIRVAGEGISLAYEDSEDIFEQLEEINNNFHNLTISNIKKNVSHISKGVREAHQKIYTLRSSSDEFTGVSTGFTRLDKVTLGWQPSNLIIIAARPSTGKTAFALNLAKNAAVTNAPVAIFELEMSESALIERLVSTESGIRLDLIKNPKQLTDSELSEVDKAFNKISSLPIHVDDTAGITIMELRAKARRLVQKNGVKLILVDYLQLVQSGEKTGNREQEISKISRELKRLAKDLSVPVIALSQISREIDKSDREPQLSDLRESGAIEQDADMVMFLWRPKGSSEEFRQLAAESPNSIMLMIKKFRDGGLADIILDFDKTIQKWSEPLPKWTQGPIFKPYAGFENARDRIIGEGNSKNIDSQEEMPF